MALPRVIKASDVREYVFCPRSLAYRHRGVQPPQEAQERREERFEQGNQSHREHGEAVCRVSRKLGYGTRLVWIGLAVVILGVAWRLFSL
jgi:CRISPR/Cas system-associated exonuclease Cas4 (RecB family)